MEVLSVLGVLDAEVVPPAAEAEPGGFDGGVHIHRSPVGIAVVGDHAAQTLDPVVLVLDGRLEPVVAVQVHDDAALVKADPGIKLRPYHEGKELLLSTQLQDGGIVVPEVIIGPLPQVGAGFGHHGDSVFPQFVLLRRSGPLHGPRIDLHVFSPVLY